jgi:hypothetical protein
MRYATQSRSRRGIEPGNVGQLKPKAPTHTSSGRASAIVRKITGGIGITFLTFPRPADGLLESREWGWRRACPDLAGA